MDLIKTGLGISKTIKNVARLREIVTVLSRNGFDEFVVKSGWHQKIPDFVLPKSQERIQDSLDEYDVESLSGSIGYRLRKSFEELGPSFVKLGQLLSTREDIFPPPFIAEMKKLQDQVKGIPFQDALAALEGSLGKKYCDVFEKIDSEPIGKASIGVVYKAILKNGDPVVVKIRRPHIAKTIETDFTIIRFLVSQLEKISVDAKHLALSRIIQDFSEHMRIELDYRIEALNCERLKQNIAKIDHEKIFHIPKVYRDVSTEEILVLEFLDGIPFSDAERVNKVRDKIQSKLEKGIRIFVHNLLVDGFFHADLHGGNFFLLTNGQIGIVDFGLVGMLGKKSRANLIAILYSMVSFNFENLVYEYLDVAEYDVIPDTDAVVKDVRQCLTPYMGLTVQQINFSQLFRAIMSTLARHRLYLPRDWFVIFRALTTLDGVGKSLDMDFDIFGIIDHDIRNIVKEQFSKDEMLEEAVWLGRDVLSSVRGLPRHVRWFMREFARRNYAFEVTNTGYEKELTGLSDAIRFLGKSVLAAVCFFSGVLMMNSSEIHRLTDLPPSTWLFWGIGMIALLWGTRPFGLRKKQ